MKVRAFVPMCILIFSGICSAADPGDAEATAENSLSFERQYFDKFNVVSALDIVLNVPGFTLDEGRSVRGYEATAGNVLIDGKRPAAKNRTLTEILSRIPASAVRRVVLVSGSAELLGSASQASVIDVVLDHSPGDTTVTYQVLGALSDGRYFSNDASLSALRHINGTNINIGLQVGDIDSVSAGPEFVNQGPSIIERRLELQESSENFRAVTIAADTANFWGGRLGFGGQYRAGTEQTGETSDRDRIEAPSVTQLRSEYAPYERYEVTTEYEYPISASKKLTGLFLADRSRFAETSIRRWEPDGVSSRAQTERKLGETIFSVAMESAIQPEHLLRFGLEYGETFVDNELALFEDEGNGEVPVDTPGANTAVEEERVEGFVSYSAPIGTRLRLDARLTVEASEIVQRGDVVSVRHFTFVKPRLAMTLNASPGSQWRLQLERLVGQLEFADFVSSNDFDDNEFEFGNPGLEPDRRWRLSVEYEHRLGAEGSIRMGVFGEDIDDVQDLLPLGGVFEVPGNIGSARIFGITVNGTVPLSFLPWESAFLDIDMRAQRTRVMDPVTFESRRLSNERDFRIDVEYRHALSQWGVDYGVKVRNRTSEYFFGLDELEIDDGYVETSLFATMTVSGRLQIGVEGNNVFDEPRRQNRFVFEENRADGQVRFNEYRERQRGREIVLTLSGQF